MYHKTRVKINLEEIHSIRKFAFFCFVDRSRARVRLRGYKENINGTNFVRFRKLQVRLRVDDAKFQLDNLFNGDPTLGEIGNAVVNANVRLILDELTPTVEENLVDIFTKLANNIMSNVTFDEMFPPQ